MLYTKLWDKTTLQFWNCNQTAHIPAKVSVFVTHYTWLWSLVSSANFMQPFFLCSSLSPVCDNLQFESKDLGAKPCTCTQAHDLCIPANSWTVAWFDRCPHPIHMKCMHGGHQHQQKFPVKICSMIRLSNENALLYCNTNIYYQIQTPQELHCCLMLAQISTTHIHKQIEPVLPYFMELKPFQSQHLRICNISLQH